MIFSIFFSKSKYTTTDENTVTSVSQLAQSGVKIGLFGSCETSIQCDTGLICDIYDKVNKLGFCKKDIGSSCIDIFECSSRAKICVSNSDIRTCQVSTEGGPGQPPGADGCMTGLEVHMDAEHPNPGICLKSTGQPCTLDNTCRSESCFDGICTERFADGQKCLRDNNCSVISGCNTNYQNNGVNNNLTKVCTDSTTHDTIQPVTPCIGNADCAAPGSECTPPYGICQPNVISARALNSVCDADHRETCADDLGCATSNSSTSIGRCQAFFDNWPVNTQCDPTPLIGRSCPIPMKCSNRFSTPTPPGCVFLPNFTCIATDFCIYGDCVSGQCKNSPDYPLVSGYKHWRWNPLKNGVVSKWGYVPNPTPSNYFDGSPTFPILTDASELHFVESEGVRYTLLQIARPPLDGSTNADIYYQIGEGTFKKITFSSNTSGLSPGNVGSFEYQVTSAFFYYDTFTLQINYPRIGFSIQATIAGIKVLLFMVLPIRTDMNYSFYFSDVYIDTYDISSGSYDSNSLTMPTMAAQVHADRGKIEFVNLSSVANSVKSYATTCTISPVAGDPNLFLLDISLTPNGFVTVPPTLDILKLQRYYGLPTITDDIAYYLTPTFDLYVRPDPGITTADLLVESNVDTFSVCQKTGSVFYVKKDTTAMVYVFRSYLGGSIYDIPFPLGTTDNSNVSFVQHLVSHENFNSTQFTGDIVLHTNTRALP